MKLLKMQYLKLNSLTILKGRWGWQRKNLFKLKRDQCERTQEK